MSQIKMGPKKQKRLPRELFRSWLRNSSNTLTPTRLTRNTKKQETPAELVVGSNALMIEKILEHVVAAKDLLNCRLVNSLWTPIATTRLVQLNTPCIGFCFYFVQNFYLSEKGQLSKLLECAKNSIKFPCTSFSFRAGDMRSEDAKEFLSTMGSSVKTLTLDAVSNGTLCSNMNLTDILSHMPNLETLIFKGGSYYDFTPKNRLTLRALKSIKFDCRYTAEKIPLILSGAPILENIVAAWNLDNVKPIVSMNKIHTVKSWCPSKYPFPDGLIELATGTEDELKLRELNIFIHDDTELDGHHTNGISTERLWKCYQKLLSANTIQKLILNCSKYPDNASFPLNMDNVKELILMPTSNPITLRHFPIGINLNVTFPRVNTLTLYDELYHVCCAGSKWKNSFPLSDAVADFNGIFPTVTTLKLRQESVSIQMLRKMKKICPNVRNLELCLFEESDKAKIIKELYGEWRSLNKLSIDLKFKSDTLKLMDSIFTGLSLESLKSLIGDPSLTDREKLRKAEDTRHVLWIGSISGLAQLDIKYEVPSCYSQESKTKTKILIPFTEFSGLYAFNLMSNLTVNLHYQTRYSFSDGEELKTALHSISRFVTISGH